jgi:hypothetical protein
MAYQEIDKIPHIQMCEMDGSRKNDSDLEHAEA